MSHLLIYPFAGAGCGAVAAMIVVPLVGGANSDIAAITLFVGTFLAGAGAIAGAVIAGAEVLASQQHVNRSQPTELNPHDPLPSPPLT